jgi:hypothetical protein
MWNPREACCLLVDIDPHVADIDWDATLFGPGMRYEMPNLRSAHLLSEKEYLDRPLYDKDSRKPPLSADGAQAAGRKISFPAIRVTAF